jgi:hypothetical protein
LIAGRGAAAFRLTSTLATASARCKGVSGAPNPGSSFVARLTREHEAAEPRPWKMGDAPPDCIAQMLRAIVGIQVETTRLRGKGCATLDPRRGL